MDFILSSKAKAMRENGMKWGSQTFLDVDYADDLGILDESVSKMIKHLEVLRVQGERAGLKINVTKTKSSKSRIK